MATLAAPAIRGFHAHSYFGPETIDQARSLCEQAAATLPLKTPPVHYPVPLSQALQCPSDAP